MYVNILLVNTRWWEGRGKIDSRFNVTKEVGNNKRSDNQPTQLSLW